MAQRVGRGIDLLFHDLGTRRGVSGQQHTPAALYPRERPGTHCTGGWVGPRASLDGRKISSPLGSDPEPSSPQSVTIPTELPGPHNAGVSVKRTHFMRLDMTGPESRGSVNCVVRLLWST